MKANELRIGNWIQKSKGQAKGKYFEVDGSIICSIEASTENEMEEEGIPITPEWLERLRWKPQKAYAEGIGLYDWHSFGTYETVNIGVGIVGIKDVHLNVTVASVRYVHQLQNLFFALTGEELTTV